MKIKVKILLTFIAGLTVVWASVTNTVELKIQNNSANHRYVGIHLINSVNNNIIRKDFYGKGPQVHGTDGNGNFNRVFFGLTMGHSYALLLKLDVDGGGGENLGDKGVLLKNVYPGAKLNLTNLTPLSQVQMPSLADVNLANKIAVCFIRDKNYTMVDLENIESMSFLASGHVSYDDSGSAKTSDMFLADGQYGNVACIVDMNNSQSIDSGDYYQITSNSISVSGGEVIAFSFEGWNVWE